MELILLFVAFIFCLPYACLISFILHYLCFRCWFACSQQIDPLFCAFNQYRVGVDPSQCIETWKVQQRVGVDPSQCIETWSVYFWFDKDFSPVQVLLIWSWFSFCIIMFVILFQAASICPCVRKIANGADPNPMPCSNVYPSTCGYSCASGYGHCGSITCNATGMWQIIGSCTLMDFAPGPQIIASLFIWFDFFLLSLVSSLYDVIFLFKAMFWCLLPSF